MALGFCLGLTGCTAMPRCGRERRREDGWLFTCLLEKWQSFFYPLYPSRFVDTNRVDRCISKPCVPLVITKAQSYLREVFCCLFIIVLTWASRPYLFLTEVQCHPLSPVLWLLHCCCYTVDLRPFFRLPCHSAHASCSCLCHCWMWASSSGKSIFRCQKEDQPVLISIIKHVPIPSLQIFF